MRKGVCTTIEQSKRLLDHGISPIDTADFLYSCIGHNPEILHYPNQWREGHWKSQMDAGAIPGWSLSALVEMLPSRLYSHGEEYFMEFFRTPKCEWVVQYPRQQFLFPIACHEESFESPVEAVVKMICYLQEELNDHDFTDKRPE